MACLSSSSSVLIPNNAGSVGTVRYGTQKRPRVRQHAACIATVLYAPDVLYLLKCTYVSTERYFAPKRKLQIGRQGGERGPDSQSVSRQSSLTD